MSPESVAAFRAEYRELHVGPSYRGWAHFAFTFLSTSALILACAWRLQDVSWREWLTVPLTFLFANWSEHLGHRHPMHRPVKGLGLVYKRHAGQHHRFFTAEAMAFETSRDFKAVLFPPVLFLFFFGAFTLPAGLLLAAVATPNVAYLFALTSVAYFLNYELLHFAYHLPEGHWVHRLPGLRALQRLHRNHHRPELMSRYNFNITYPLADWLYGTWYREGRDEGRLRCCWRR